MTNEIDEKLKLGDVIWTELTMIYDWLLEIRIINDKFTTIFLPRELKENDTWL